tara:strand:+ start:88 stop:282 length:195 start_codon:yes stop_codon:yes gene_type:complete
MTCDKHYIHRTIVNALSNEGNNFVKPSASFAKILEAVPSVTAAIKKEYVISIIIFYIYLVINIG